MKVGFVYPIGFGDAGVFGGGERFVLELASFMSRVAETVLVTFGSARQTERVGALRVETYPWLTLVRGRRHNPLGLSFLRSLVAVDVIHCLSYNTLMTDLSLLFGRLSGKRVFITDVGGGADITLARWFDMARLSTALLLLSSFASRSFRGNRHRQSVIYGAADTERFIPDGQTRIPSVVYAGRILPHKGINYLIDAIDTETPLTVIGRPYHRAYFDDLVRLAAGKRVTFLTAASDDDLIAHYRASAAVVLPSVYRDMYGQSNSAPELLGLTLLEAMACGAPVICTAVGGMPEIVEDGVSGFVVPPNDSPALADKITRLTTDLGLARRMGTAARSAVLDRFTWTTVVNRCLTAYQNLARNGLN